MRFPLCLKRNDRSAFAEDKILKNHYLYAYHIPGHDWNDKMKLPDYTKIKMDQSFFWCAFSIPIWARFKIENAKIIYKENHAVVAYKVKTIRYTKEINPNFENFTLTVIHKPEDFNYSHCELKQKRELKRKERREIRMTLKHQSKVPLKPWQKQNKIRIFFSKLRMFLYKISVYFVTRILFV